MGYIDHPVRRNEFAEIVGRVQTLETASPLGNSSISQGRLRIVGNESLLVEGSEKVVGWLVVTGTERVTGLLEVLGTFSGNGEIDWTGTAAFSGDTEVGGGLNVTGDAVFTGDTDIGGTLDVTGLVRLFNDLIVQSGGKIVAADMRIEDGKVKFDTGGSIESYSGGLRVVSGGGPDVVVSTGGVSITGGGGVYLTIASGGHILGGHGTTTDGANANINSTTGQLRRVTSARRFKVDPQPMELPEDLLYVTLKDWLDSGAVEREEPERRVPGVIAEEVAEAGGEVFVTRGPDGEIDGLAYDRLALARTQILADKLDRALTRIEELEARVASLGS